MNWNERMNATKTARRGFLLAAVASAAMALGACQSNDGNGTSTGASTTSASAPVAAQPKRDVTVFAATSLRDAFTAASAEYKKAAPEVNVVFNFAGTQELRAQVEQGAKADVFAGADTKHVDELAHQGLVLASKVFAENEPVLVVAKDSTTPIKTFAELPSVKRVVLGAADVPIGRYSAQILDKATQALGGDFATKVNEKVVSRELNVRQVLAKLTLGEADAAIVYRTDVNAAAKEKVNVLEIPAEVNVIARYPIAVVAKTEHQADAQGWVNWVTSDAGRAVLIAQGFKAPSPNAP